MNHRDNDSSLTFGDVVDAVWEGRDKCTTDTLVNFRVKLGITLDSPPMSGLLTLENVDQDQGRVRHTSGTRLVDPPPLPDEGSGSESSLIKNPFFDFRPRRAGIGILPIGGKPFI